MILLAVLASTLSATTITVSGVQVSVAANPRFGQTYELSVPTSAASPVVLRHVLVEAAARRTLADGRHAFTVGTRVIGATVAAKLSEADQRVFLSADRTRLVLHMQELPETGTPRDESIDAVQALNILHDS